MPIPTRRFPIAAAWLSLAAITACVTRAPGPGDSAAAATTPPTATASTSAVDSTGQVELRTDRSTYRAGEKGTLTIVNRGSLGWTFNPCTRTVEREDAGRWLVVAEGRMCTMEAWILKPGETRTAPLDFAPTLGPGRYRLTIGFTGDGEPAGRRLSVTSAPLMLAR